MSNLRATLTPSESHPATHAPSPSRAPPGGKRISAGGRRSSASGASGPARSVAEVERIELEWQALSCCYRTNAGAKWVLKDVWGVAHPGEMQALLGPSGAGKSTLMDMVAQRKSTGSLSGAVLVDGVPADGGFIRRTAYVPQYDNFVPFMSAGEVMQFYAGMILPRDWRKERRAARVDEVMREMGLAHAVRTLVGGEYPGGLLQRGLSGGERKRLSIAAGILAAPSVVFLDEPTTGLDSFAALTVMGYMKRMARDNGHIVIASIHQPRSAIWSMFDAVTLLSCGRLMYTGICDGLVEWFSSIGFDYDANLHGVVSDWALDLVACGSHKPRKFYGSTITTREEVRAVSQQFLARWMEARGVTLEDLSVGGGRLDSAGGGVVTTVRKPRAGNGVVAASAVTASAAHHHAHGGGGAGGVRGGAARRASLQTSSGGAFSAIASAVAERRLAREIAAMHSSAGGEAAAAAGARPSSWGQQYWWALRRELLMITRNSADVAGRTLTNAWVAAAMGLMYYDLTFDSGSLRSRVNMLLNILAFFCLMPYISMSLYTAGKKFYLADVSAKLYTPSAYYLAKVTATVPFQVVSALVYTWIIYGMAGLRADAGAVLGIGAITTLVSLIAVQVMHLCATVAPTQDVAFMYRLARWQRGRRGFGRCVGANGCSVLWARNVWACSGRGSGECAAAACAQHRHHRHCQPSHADTQHRLHPYTQ